MRYWRAAVPLFLHHSALPEAESLHTPYLLIRGFELDPCSVSSCHPLPQSSYFVSGPVGPCQATAQSIARLSNLMLSKPAGPLPLDYCTITRERQQKKRISKKGGIIECSVFSPKRTPKAVQSKRWHSRTDPRLTLCFLCSFSAAPLSRFSRLLPSFSFSWSSHRRFRLITRPHRKPANRSPQNAAALGASVHADPDPDRSHCASKVTSKTASNMT